MKKTLFVIICICICFCICLILPWHDSDNLISSRRSNENNVLIILDELCSTNDEIDNNDICIQLFNMINEYRKQNGLNELVWSSDLAYAAEIRASESIVEWSHTRPDGTEYWTVNPDIVYGENLARGFSTPQGVLKGWQNSVSHNANLLYPGYRYAGISCNGTNFAIEFCY